MADIVVHPATGEVLDLQRADLEQLGRWLLEARELDEQMRSEKRRVVAELLSRMDREARYTLRAADLELKGDGPEAPIEYDVLPLRQALAEFVEAEVITQEALDRAIEPVTVYKPRANGLKPLVRQGGPLAETIAHYASPKESYERRVSVKAAAR